MCKDVTVDGYEVVLGTPGTDTDTGDGFAATSTGVKGVSAVWIDSLGEMYFADYVAHELRRVGVDGIVYAIGGDGTPAHDGDGQVAGST